jgi:putative Holliday junction resolvase
MKNTRKYDPAGFNCKQLQPLPFLRQPETLRGVEYLFESCKTNLLYYCKMRILCLDVGDRRIGVALSDPTLTLAQPLIVHTRTNLRSDLEAFKKIAAEHEVGKIVVGLPKDLSGAMGTRAQSVAQFAGELEKHTGIPVELWDERFSTNEAGRIFELAEVSHKKRKPFIDMMAAQIILQGYLDAQKTR